MGDSVLVVAQSLDQLARAAEQKNSLSRKNEIARFLVPPGTDANRFSSPLQLPTKGIARIAPEFVNIRHRVVQGADVTIDDMQPLPETQFNDVLKAGKYEAVHFIDDTCDGVVVAVVVGLPGRRRNFPAYSLVTALICFPLADQLEVANWVRHDLKGFGANGKSGAYSPRTHLLRKRTRMLNMDDLFKGRQFDREIIILCVRWYLRFKLNFRDLVEMMAERGISLAHTTIMRWIARYVPEFEKRWNRFACRVGTSWRVDETYVKIKGKWTYLYRAVDKQGKTVDFLLRAKRDVAAAKAFFRRAFKSQGRLPQKITLDGYQACMGLWKSRGVFSMCGSFV